MKQFTKDEVAKMMETEEGKRELFNAVVDVALAIQGKFESVEAPKNKKEKATPTVFINYSGHTNALEVRVHEKGWKAGKYPDLSLNFHFVGSDDHKNIVEWKMNTFTNNYEVLRATYERLVGAKND